MARCKRVVSRVVSEIKLRHYPTTGDFDSHISQLVATLGEDVGESRHPSARDSARDALGQAIVRYGPVLADQPRRVEAFLRDVAGEHKAEVVALSVAAAEGVGAALLESSQGMQSTLVAQLSARLEDNRGLAADLARWAVEAWGHVLGVGGQAAAPGADDVARQATVPVIDGTLDRAVGPLEGEQVEAVLPPDSEREPVVPAEPEMPEPGVAAEPKMPAELEPSSESVHAVGEPLPSREPAPPAVSDALEEELPPLAAQVAQTQALGEERSAKVNEPAVDGPPPGEGQTLARDTPERKSKRWRIWAGVGAAVIGIGIVAQLTGGDESGSPNTTFRNSPTTAAEGSTATTIREETTTTPTTVTTTLAGGRGTAAAPYSLPHSQSFSGPVGVFDRAERSTEVGTWKWDVVAGQLQLDAQVISGTQLFWSAPRFTLPSAYEVSVDTNQSASTAVACGIHIRGSATESPGFYFVVDSAEQEYRVLKFAADTTASTLARTTFDDAIRKDGVNHVGVAIDGADFTFKVNGETLLEVTDADITTVTRLGLAGSIAASDPEQCRFDEFSVLEGNGDTPTAGSEPLALDPSDLGPGWALADGDQSQTRDMAFPIHCGGTEASGTVRLADIKSQSYTNEGETRRAFVLVAESEADLIDALFVSQRANLAFCDAGGGFLRPVASTTPPDLGRDALAGRSLLTSDDTQFTMIKVSSTRVLYTLLYSPTEEMASSEGNDFAEAVFGALF